MEAGPVQDNTAIQEWHFNILAVKVYDEDATVTAAYRAEVLQAHPNRNHTGVNAVVKTQMLNEAESVLLNKQKRKNFERKCLSGVTNSDVGKGDSVMIHSLATKHYNLTFGRVVSDNLGNMFEKKFTVTTQHSCVQYDTTHVDDNVSYLIMQPRLGRVYGEPERKAAGKQWSKYYVKNDSVIIKNVEEGPWYNNMEATIMGYNHDLMRFNVVLGGHELALMPQNIFLSKVSLEDVEAQRTEVQVKEAERTLAANRWSMRWKKDDRVMISVSTQRCRSPCLLNVCRSPCLLNVCRPSECDAHAVGWRPIGVYIALKIGRDRPRSAEMGRDRQRSAEIGRDRHSTVDLCVDVALSMCRLSTGNRQIECRLSPEMQAIGR